MAFWCHFLVYLFHLMIEIIENVKIGFKQMSTCVRSGVGGWGRGDVFCTDVRHLAGKYFQAFKGAAAPGDGSTARSSPFNEAPPKP